jgi:hypothetical protein
MMVEDAKPLKELSKLEREEIMLSRNQFKKKQKARAKSKVRGAESTAGKMVVKKGKVGKRRFVK